MTPHNNESATPRLPWLSMSAVILLAAALLVVFRPNLQKRLEASFTPQADAGPSLRATPEGNALRIAWPPSETATLSIKDGDEWHRIELNQQAQATGQFLYRPSSTEVLVRLDKAGATEIVRLIGLPPAPAPIVEVAQAPPPPPPAAEQTADRALVTPPEIAGRKAPPVLPQALRSIRGNVRVDVRVAIAPDGSVQSAELLQRSQSPYFNRLSLTAAQTSRFQPSAAGNSLVLRYEYSRDGVQVTQPAQ